MYSLCLNKNVGVFVLSFWFAFFFIGNTSACSECGWDLFAEELFPSLCPIFSSTTSFFEELLSPLRPKKNEGTIPPDLVKECLKCARDLSKSSIQRGNQLVRGGASLEPLPPAVSLFFSVPLSSEVKKASDASREILAATKLLQMKMCASSDVTPNTFMSFLDSEVIQAHSGTSCKPVSIKCGKDKYRSMDGSCNNLQHPSWGRKGAAFTRIASPRYADGIHSMPVAISGRPLPNPRALSTRLFVDLDVPSCSLNYLNMQWGQFITHDLMLHMMEVTDEGGIQCCLGEGTDVLPPELLNDKCIPIRIPDEDPFYRQYGIKCLNFVRSITAPRDDCSFGYADQMNTVSSFLDASSVYNSDKKKSLDLRSQKGGRLREETRKKCRRGFLPTVKDKTKACDLRNSSDPCYMAGDGRVNQTPTLAMLHTLVLREHNRVADILSGLNPLWTDERLFQETRRIVIAEIQHITYQEWLPLNFGESYFRYYQISSSSLYSRDYDEDVNPSILNSFGAAAFRFLHSLVPATIMTCPANYHAAYLHKLSDNFQDPVMLESGPDAFDDVVRGTIAQSSSESDPWVTSEISNLLFKSHNPWGLDLIAIDVQRGRDHGIASYNEYREICGLRRATSFSDLGNEISQDRIYALSQLYESVDDIDLYVGGAMERNVPGSILGPTFQCIVAEQFYRTRVGDRFFYDNGEMPHSFTKDQLQQLKKASMARLICDNTDVDWVQRAAFRSELPANGKCRCDDYFSIPYVDLTAWKAVSIFD